MSYGNLTTKVCASILFHRGRSPPPIVNFEDFDRSPKCVCLGDCSMRYKVGALAESKIYWRLNFCLIGSRQQDEQSWLLLLLYTTLSFISSWTLWSAHSHAPDFLCRIVCFSIFPLYKKVLLFDSPRQHLILKNIKTDFR